MHTFVSTAETSTSCDNAPFMANTVIDKSKVYFGYLIYRCSPGKTFKDGSTLKAVYCPCNGDWITALTPIKIGRICQFPLQHNFIIYHCQSQGGGCFFCQYLCVCLGVVDALLKKMLLFKYKTRINFHKMR